MSARLTLVVVGAQKARTSTLASSFAQHPEIYFHPKEVAIFENPYVSVRRTEEFAAFLEQRSEPVVGFKRADLLGRPEAAQNLRLAFQGPVHLVVSLRHPVDRAISAFYWYVRQGLLPAWSIEVVFEHLVTNGALDGFPRSGEILRYGHYTSGIERFQRVFGQHALTVEADDGWTAAAVGALGERIGLVGLRVAPGTHEKRGSYSLVRARATALADPPRGFCPNWRRGPSDGSYRAALERRLRDIYDEFLLSRLCDNDPISDDTLEALDAYYKPEVESVRHRFGVKLSSAWLPTGRRSPSGGEDRP